MKLKLTFKAALAGTAAALSLTAGADAQQGYYGGYDQLYLFSGENFRGTSVVIDGPIERLSYVNFNDRADSVDFTGPGWLLCKHAEFEGPCIVARGPIADLDAFGLGGEISSARPLSEYNPYPHGTIFGLDYYGDIVFYDVTAWGSLVEIDPYDAWGYGYGDGYRSGAYGDYGRYGRYDPYNPYYDYNRNDWTGYRGPRNADIVLYRDSNYRGAAYGLSRDTWNLSTLYFNDQVSSIEIRRGTWEICTDSNFGGRCQIFHASQSSLTGLRFNDNISSIRRVDGNRGTRHGQNQNYYNGSPGRGGDRDHHDGGRDGHGGHGGYDGRDGRGGRNGDVMLFEHSNYGGRYVSVNGDIANLSTLGLNDSASSIRITSGTWEICEHPNFQGRCQIVNADTARLNGYRLNDNVSSIRRVSGSRTQPGQRPGGGSGNQGGDRNTGSGGRGNDQGGRDRDDNRGNDRGGPNTGGGYHPGDRDQGRDQGRDRDRDGSGTRTTTTGNTGGGNPRALYPSAPPPRADQGQSGNDQPSRSGSSTQPRAATPPPRSTPTPRPSQVQTQPRDHDDHPRWGSRPEQTSPPRVSTPTRQAEEPKGRPQFTPKPQPRPEPVKQQQAQPKPQQSTQPVRAQPKPQPDFAPKPRSEPAPAPKTSTPAPSKPVARTPPPRQDAPKYDKGKSGQPR